MAGATPVEPVEGHRTRRPRWAGPVLVAVLAWLGLAAWAFASPTMSSPDDDYHLARIYCAAGAADCDVEGTRTYPCFAWQATITGDCSPAAGIVSPAGFPKATEPSGQLTVPPTVGISDTRPELYEQVMARFVGATLDRTSSTVRLVNVTLAVLLALASVWLSAPRLRRAVALSWLITTIPLGLFMMSSVNAHAWTIMGVAALWGPLLSVLQGNRVDRTAVLRTGFSGLAAVMALGSRSESPLYVVIAVAAIAILGLRRTGSQGHRRLSAGIVGGVVLISGLAFVALSWVRLDFLLAVPSRNPDAGPWDLLMMGLDRLSAVVVQPQLGWLDTSVPLIATALVTAALGGAFLLGAGQMSRRKAAAAVLLGGACVALPVVMAMRGDNQPRYYLPLVIVLTGVMLVPVRRDVVLPDRLQAGLMLMGLALANSLALLATLGRFIVARPDAPFSPGDLAAAATPGWWAAPVPPAALWIIGTLSFLAALAGLWWVLWPRSDTARSARVIDVRGTTADDTGQPLPVGGDT